VVFLLCFFACLLVDILCNFPKNAEIETLVVHGLTLFLLSPEFHCSRNQVGSIILYLLSYHL
jgi:uncharacterized protein YhhL (DUF1145 family)